MLLHRLRINLFVQNNLFTIKPIHGPIPERAQIYESVECDMCHEITMETRMRRIHGNWLCLPCYEKMERKI